MSRLWLILLFFVFPALAVDSLEQRFTCPICGTEWSERIEIQGHSRGIRLDLRQLGGEVVDPPTLPQCPKCRFVIFTEDLKPSVLEKLKPFIQGQDYQLFAAKSPTYYSLAQIQQFLKAPPRFLAMSYLRAAWQVEDKPFVARRYLVSAEEQFTRALGGMIPEEKDYPNTALLRGEILRRLERWEDAGEQFRVLAPRTDFQDPRKKHLLEQELDLVARKDSQPQQLREPGAVSLEPEMLPDPEIISVRKP
jgi:hypothetical protein